MCVCSMCVFVCVCVHEFHARKFVCVFRVCACVCFVCECVFHMPVRECVCVQEFHVRAHNAHAHEAVPATFT